jgi:excinuclease ABC subunit A
MTESLQNKHTVSFFAYNNNKFRYYLMKGFAVVTLSVRGAQEHNLKKINIDIPKNQLIAVTGVSGSGKSSLVFHTIYAEAFRRFADASQVPIFMMGRSLWSQISRPRFQSLTGLPPALGLSQKQGIANKISTVGTISGISDLLRVYFSAFGDIFCRTCDIPLRAISFSYLCQNVMTHWRGKKIMIIAPLCEKRKGGFAEEILKFRQLGFSKIRLNEKIYDLQDDSQSIPIDTKKLNTLDVIIDYCLVSPEKTQRIERALFQALEYGKNVVYIESSNEFKKFNTRSLCPQCEESAVKLDPRYFSHSSLGQCPQCAGEGSLKPSLETDLFPCPTCQGSRLNLPCLPIVRVFNVSYPETHFMTIAELKKLIQEQWKIDKNQEKSKFKIYSEILSSLHSLIGLGLGHLNLNRSGTTLAPGDLQRIRLASLISNHLTGVLYVLDEPCQGLTHEEVQNVVNVVKDLIKKKATVLAVEHHPVFLSHCDTLVLMGPGAGSQGGEIISVGPPPAKSQSKPWMRQDNTHKKSGTNNSLVFSQLQVRQIKKDHIEIMQNKITILHGKSGSGKRSFVELCLLPALRSFTKKMVPDPEAFHIPFKNFCKIKISKNFLVHAVHEIKPGSLVKSSRKSVASALEIMKPLRALFATLTTSQMMGLTENHFSWHSHFGKCEKCFGRGYTEIQNRFANALKIDCEFCLGARLNSRSLVPRFKGLHFFDLMCLTIEDAYALFSTHKFIAKKLEQGLQFGLGYIKLGQTMDMLSGGELQRLNLTLELKHPYLEGVWFLLTHPSTGLHEPDLKTLGQLISLMSKRGASFILIENREELFEYADAIIDF